MRSLSLTSDTLPEALLIYESNSRNSEQLVNDLVTVFDRLKNKSSIKAKELLFYIDATNGHVFISGYNHEADEVFDESTILLELRQLWEEDDNAYNFDAIVIDSIVIALKTKIGVDIKKEYRVFYKTEIDPAERIE